MENQGISKRCDYFEQLISINQFQQKKLRKNIEKLKKFQEIYVVLFNRILSINKYFIMLRNNFLTACVSEKNNLNLNNINELINNSYFNMENNKKEIELLILKLKELEEREKIYKQKLKNISAREFFSKNQQENRAFVREFRV